MSQQTKNYNNGIPWTHFWDMHSGGGSKEKQNHIFINAKQEEAELVFYHRFGHNPSRISCTCCGNDYAVTQYNSLDEATRYQRQRHGNEQDLTIEQFIICDDVLLIFADEIKPEEKIGELPEQGYVWKD